MLFNKDDIDPTSIGFIGACFKNASLAGVCWFNAGSDELLETDLVFELLLASESADFFFRLDTGGPIIYFIEGRFLSRHKQRFLHLAGVLLENFFEGSALLRLWYVNSEEKICIFGIMYQCLNGSIPSMKFSIKAHLLNEEAL